ncbi:unnamed protein product, partial [Didymodactylos carnosus]
MKDDGLSVEGPFLLDAAGLSKDLAEIARELQVVLPTGAKLDESRALLANHPAFTN